MRLRIRNIAKGNINCKQKLLILEFDVYGRCFLRSECFRLHVFQPFSQREKGAIILVVLGVYVIRANKPRHNEKSGADSPDFHSRRLAYRALISLAGRYFRIKWSAVLPVAAKRVRGERGGGVRRDGEGQEDRRVQYASEREMESRDELILSAGSRTSAKFVIDRVKADRAPGHYADQEIRIPPRCDRMKGLRWERSRLEGVGSDGRPFSLGGHGPAPRIRS